IQNERRRVAGAERLALDAPGRLAGPGEERLEVRRAVLVVVDDDQAVINDGRKTGAVLTGEFAQVALPGELAIEVVGIQPDAPAVPEDAVDALAVAARGAGGHAASGVRLADDSGHLLRPQLLALVGVDANDHALLGCRAEQEDLALDDDGRRVPRTD